MAWRPSADGVGDDLPVSSRMMRGWTVLACKVSGTLTFDAAAEMGAKKPLRESNDTYNTKITLYDGRG